RKAIRLTAQLTARDTRLRRWASPAWIPLPLLPRFAFASTGTMDEPGFLPSATVFDRVRAAGGTWYLHAMPTYRVAAALVQDRFVNEFDGHESYAFIHIGDLDRTGHHYGPWSAERKSALRRVDRVLSQIIAHAQACARQVDVLILGDHGMAQVERTVDVRPAIGRLTARGLTFDYFIDATLFRCWSRDTAVLHAIGDEFDRIPGLTRVSEVEALRYGLCYRHSRFWDACWQAEEGLVFTPNFHNSHERLLGMHGYLPECRDNRSAFVLSSARLPARLRGQSLHEVDMRRFFATQLTLLGLPQPSPLSASLL
ncbi:MAG: alkaline phosphatase family protein, partial [Nitrososphaerales archaeon]